MTPNTICCGDCLSLLAAEPAASVDLVFADPPFNIGYVYDNYNDDRPNREYVDWTRAWMAACRRVLTASGSFYIAIGDDFAADVRIIGRDLGLHLRNWIIWHYTFGQATKTMFGRSHTHIFYFSKHPTQFTFNEHLLRFPSARHTEYQDLRANPRGRLPDDVWTEFPRVCGTFRERAGFHGCQMPEALLQRIVMASSNPGDVVLDPFVGSGTTVVAAKRLGRRYIGIDVSPEYATHAGARVARTPDESRARRRGDAWPSLHVELLFQLYRETKVTFDNLIGNAVALRVIAASLSARTGESYSEGDVAAKLTALRSERLFPKLPNDRPFVARNHVKSEGKRYQRRVFRVRPRRTRGAAGERAAAAPVRQTRVV